MDDRLDAGTRAWVEEFVRHEIQSSAVEVWMDRITRRIDSGVPEVRNDAVLRETVTRAARAQWIAFLGQVGQPALEFVLVPEAAEVATSLAQRGHQMTVALGIYTHARREIWQHMTSVVDLHPEEEFDDRAVLVHLWSRANAWIDSSIEESLALYATETDRVRQGDAARRLESITAILDGHVTDARKAAASLGGYAISGVNTAILLHTHDDDVISELRGAATKLVQTLELAAPLVIQPGGRSLWCWVSSRRAPDPSLLGPLADWLAQRRVSAVVGSSLPGVAGFRQSHRDALAAQSVAVRSITAESLTLFRDVELLTLVASPEGAERFVRRTLGALGEDTDSAARLRHTVHTFLRLGSVDAAARELSVHKNTIRYRVDRAEELLGRPLQGASTEIELALRWYARFPVGTVVD